MPAPTVATYSAAALIAAHNAFRDLLDSHATQPALLRIRSAAGALLAEVALADPCGTINGTTGQLAFDVDPVPASTGLADGTAAYGEFCDGAGAVHLALPCVQGSAPVAGSIVLSSLAVITGTPVQLLSATVG